MESDDGNQEKILRSKQKKWLPSVTCLHVHDSDSTVLPWTFIVLVVLHRKQGWHNDWSILTIKCISPSHSGHPNLSNTCVIYLIKSSCIPFTVGLGVVMVIFKLSTCTFVSKRSRFLTILSYTIIVRYMKACMHKTVPQCHKLQSQNVLPSTLIYLNKS